MTQRSAIHKYADGSKHVIDVIYQPTAPFPIRLHDRDGDSWYDIGISSSSQAFQLAELLERAGERLARREARRVA